jgi:hypothetical protein
VVAFWSEFFHNATKRLLNLWNRIETQIELKAPVARVWRVNALRGNEGGWTQQMKNIEAYVTQGS